MSKDYFNLYANCVVVKGASESLIVDFQNSHFYNIPNLLSEILLHCNNLKINDVKKIYKNEYDKGIDKYLNELIRLEIGFFLDDPEEFPKLSMYWDNPSEIQTSVIEINGTKPYDYINVIEQLCDLGCNVIQIRIVNFCSEDILFSIHNKLKSSRIKYIEYVIHSQIFDIDFTKFFFYENNRIFRFIVHGTQKEDFSKDNLNLQIKDWQLVFITEEIHPDSKDLISKKSFCPSLDFFTEAQSHNPSLNRKISIDRFGSIKNYLSHEKIYGNIQIDKLSTIIKTEQFTSMWYINNDSIEVCKECQYRYICFSNSDIEEKNNTFYKKQMCNFNPQTNQWVE